jgi:hypothetical protein
LEQESHIEGPKRSLALINDKGLLTLSIIFNQPEIFRRLLDLGADVYRVAAGGTRRCDAPLNEAAQAFSRHPFYFNEMVARGANVTQLEDGGNSVLFHLIGFQNSSEAVASVLRENPALLDSLAPPNYHIPPLPFAAAFSAPETVEAIIEAGADITAIDKVGYTALDWAIASSRPEGINNLKLLLDHEKYAQDSAKETRLGKALSYACFNNNVKALSLLLDRGANPNYQARNGESPLLSASLRFAIYQENKDPKMNRVAQIEGERLKAVYMKLVGHGLDKATADEHTKNHDVLKT